MPKEERMFVDMTDAIWYALITMYTVGYGDQVPVTTLGRLVGTCCAILGLLDMAFSLPIIVFEFNYLYNLDRDDCKLSADELIGEATREKSVKIDSFNRSLTRSLRRNKTSLNMLSSSVRDDCGKTGNMTELWNYAKQKNRKLQVNGRNSASPVFTPITVRHTPMQKRKTR